MKNKIAIIILCDNFIGGAQNRYLNIINNISLDENYIVIMNEEFYDFSYHYKGLIPSKQIITIPIINNKNRNNIKIYNDSKSESHNKNGIIIFRKVKKIKWWLGKLYNWFRFITKAHGYLKANQVSVVYSIWMGGIWIWPLKYILKFKLIHSYNDSSVSSVSRKLFDIFGSEYWVLKSCDKIDFLSSNYIKLLQTKIGKIQNDKIYITPNSFIVYDKFYPEHPKTNTVVFLSRLITYKNPLLFLDAVYDFNSTYNIDDVKFLIIGEGPLEIDIKNKINQNYLTNVSFIGKVENSWQYLRKSKVFVSIQQNENYPSQSLLEAMACENAIIASDVGETRKLVSENEGILVNLSVKEISNALYVLLTTQNNYGINARKKVLAEHNIKNYLNYFKSILR